MTPPIQRALISVSDKTGVAEFANALVAMGVEIVSTGGSARTMREAGIPVTDVANITGFPEMMDGRVKTLHPMVHGGILALRDNADHQQALTTHAITPIDMVVVNLYPFAQTVASGADYDTCIENIDIGGPAMVRASAKNHKFVTIITNPADYAGVLSEMADNGGSTTLALRQRLARDAYAHTAQYDSRISAWLSDEMGDILPPQFSLSGDKKSALRYGENSHQQAGFYTTGDTRPSVATATQLQGKEISYNNLNDADSALQAVAEFTNPAVVIVKHANPCGVAVAPNSNGDLCSVWQQALACDPVSAFGGIVAVNRAVDGNLAKHLTELFLEVIIAPEFTADAQAVLSAKKNVRLLQTGGMPTPTDTTLQVKSLGGGFLLQTGDNRGVTESDLTVVTKRQPTPTEIQDMLFAWKVAKHVKSNAIVYARDLCTTGIGAGQMNRLDSSRIATIRGNEQLGIQGSVVASDAFFPFADGLLSAVNNGATAVIQPGGSIRDEEVIKSADEAGIAMVYTAVRHFKH